MDNTTINAGMGGDPIRDLDRQAGGIKTQVVQLDLGGSSSNAENLITAGPQTPANSVPVIMASVTAPVSLTTVGQIAQITNPGYNTAGVQLTALNGGAVQFVGSGDGANWVPMQGITGGIAGGLTGTSTTGGWQVDIGGVSYFGVQCLAAGSAAIVGTIMLSGAASVVNLDGGTGQEKAANSWPVVVASDQVVQTQDQTLSSAQSSDAPIFAAITGDPSGDLKGVNLLEEVIHGGNGLTVGVSLKDGLLTDANKAIVLSDGVIYTFKGLAAQSQQLGVYLCDGYSSVEIHNVGPGTPTVSSGNNGVDWVPSASGLTRYGALSAGVVAAGDINSFPVNGKFLRLVANGTAAFNFTVRLKYGPSALTNANIAGVSGTAAATGGVAGLLAVGGNIAPAAARTSNPVPVGGVDAANLTRTLLTDVAGRPVLATFGQGTSTPVMGSSLSYLNAGALNVEDVDTVDGASQIELLSQIRDEMRINNRIAAAVNKNLAGILASLASNGVMPIAQPETANDPDEYRLDSTSLTSVQ